MERMAFEDICPSGVRPDPVKCGMGQGPECCIYLVSSTGGFACGRGGIFAPTVEQRAASGEMKSQRKPMLPYPLCQEERTPPTIATYPEDTEGEIFLKQSGVTPKRWGYTDFPQPHESMRNYYVRDDFIAKFSFAIPTKKALEVVGKYAPILEVGAGSGYWAYELRKLGVDVIATEPKPGEYKAMGRHIWDKQWTEVETLAAKEAVVKYPDRNLLVVWPSLGDPWAYECLRRFKAKFVLYIGEGHGGCTADDRFHIYLKKKFTEVDSVSIPQFWGIHDHLEIWERK
jgi:hypothetical protein